MAIYQDKVFVATTDARLVALDARTGARRLGHADRRSHQGLRQHRAARSSIKGKVIQGLVGCDRYGNDGCFISAYDAATGKQLWKFNTVARAGEPGGDTWGKLADNLRRRRDLDHRQLRSGSRTSPTGASRRPSRGCRASRGTSSFDNALYTSSTVALTPDDGKLAWHYQHAPGESLDLDEVFERVLVDIGDQKVVFTIGKAGILWKLDRKTGKYLGTRRRVFQNVFDRSIRRPARRPIAPTSSSRRSDEWIAVVPEHRGRPQLAGDELHQPTRHADHSAEPVVHGDARRARSSQTNGSGGTGARSPLLRDARHATATSASSPPSTSKTMKEVWSHEQRAPFLTACYRRPAASAFVGDLDRTFRAFDVQDRRDAVADAPRHVGAGLSRCRSAPTASSTSRSRPGSAAAARASCRARSSRKCEMPRHRQRAVRVRVAGESRQVGGLGRGRGWSCRSGRRIR